MTSRSLLDIAELLYQITNEGPTDLKNDNSTKYHFIKLFPLETNLRIIRSFLTTQQWVGNIIFKKL